MTHEASTLLADVGTSQPADVVREVRLLLPGFLYAITIHPDRVTLPATFSFEHFSKKRSACDLSQWLAREIHQQLLHLLEDPTQSAAVYEILEAWDLPRRATRREVFTPEGRAERRAAFEGVL